MKKGLARKNVHLTLTFGSKSSRILREVNSLKKLNLVDVIEVFSMYISDADQPEVASDNSYISTRAFANLHVVRGIRILQYLLFLWKAFRKFCFLDLHSIHCHSLHVLPLGVLLKLLRRSTFLIYDPHEMEAHRVGYSKVTIFIIVRFERFWIQFADKVITVSEPIKSWYCNTYRLDNVYVIRNLPEVFHKDQFNVNLKEYFKIDASHLLFVYQGVIDSDRGIGSLLSVFEQCSKDKHIVFIGYGAGVDKVTKSEKENCNIHFHPAVSSKRLMSYTRCASVGIFFVEENKGLSYKYSFPNKFAEYILAGLPVIVSSHFEYLGEIVINNKLGWVVGGDTNILLALINSLKPEVVEKVKIDVNLYSDSISYLEEEKVYLKIFS
jgi:glycosyltransferase involved in cell wall biosynthesis